MSTPPPAPKRLGLTGSIGAGKSTVARLLRQRGLPVLDADAAAHWVTEQPEVLQELEQLFPGVIEAGALNRRALAQRVFHDPAALARLNALIHPRVRARLREQEEEAVANGAPWVVQDIPLLFENGLEGQMDAVLVVDAPLEQRLARVQTRSDLSREEVLAREAHQLPAQQKRARADAVLDNDGNLAQLEVRLDQALKRLGLL